MGSGGGRLNSLRAVARLRLARLSLGALLGAGALAIGLPLLSVPGYELAELLAILAALLGAALGIAAVRTPQGRQRPARAALATGVWVALGAAGGTAVTTAGDLLGRRCSPLPGLPFLLLLPLPSALLAAALGGASGRLFRRGWAAGLAAAALLLGNLAISVWPLYAGPQVYAFSHLFGWFPGPLYDELLTPPPALWIFRALTLLAAAAVLLALAAFETRRPLGRLAGSALLIAAFLLGVSQEHRFGAATSTGDIDRALGGRLEAAGLVLHYPRELAAPDVDRLQREVALDRWEVDAALGVSGGPPVEVFFYRDAGEKGRLTGASGTHYTKPWLRQIHTHQDPEGRQVLRHEMVHALAAPLGRAPFGVCARFFGLDVQAGIVEGLAMAVDWPAGELTLHQWSRAMREAKLAPDIRSIVGPAGFLSQAQGRAYTLAGSFLRWLLDRYGRDEVARLYRDGDFLAAYGRPLGELAAEWERFVDAVPLDADARGAAEDRFRRPSLFSRPCAREMAELVSEAAAAAGTPLREAEILERCTAIDPGDPSLLERRWEAERAAGLPGAADTLSALLASPALDPILRARVERLEGDRDVAAGDTENAYRDYSQALAAHVDRSTRRQVEILLASLALPPEAPRAVAAYLDPRGSGATELATIVELWQAQPLFAPAAYLLGLRFGEAGERARGLAYLDRALAGALPPDVVAEALRRGAAFDIDLGLYGEAAGRLAKLAALDRPPAEEVQREDLARRLEFERSHYGRGIPGLR
ncbi:MAG: type VI secretion system protein [Myxococcales bacterium]